MYKNKWILKFAKLICEKPIYSDYDLLAVLIFAGSLCASVIWLVMALFSVIPLIALTFLFSLLGAFIYTHNFIAGEHIGSTGVGPDENIQIRFIIALLWSAIIIIVVVATLIKITLSSPQ